VYPCLIITYLGQASVLLFHPEWIQNTFYLCIPGGIGTGIYWIMMILATLTTIIASQSMILSIFSIVLSFLLKWRLIKVYQAIQMDYFPSLKIINIDSKIQGRIYIPIINWYLNRFKENS
jgi:KUP system potassium uptake protein